MGYITEERTETLRCKVTVGAKCDNCKLEIDLAIPSSLDVILVGGYGKFFDDSDVRIMLCQACAVKLLEAFPTFAEQMKAQETW